MNQEGYKDPTAEEAVAKVMKEYRAVNSADRTAVISYLMRLYRKAASDAGFEITNRIIFRDKESGKEYR